MSRKKNGSDQLTLFAGGSHASHSATQESETEQQMTAISGRKCYESSERLNRHGLLAKTLLASCRWTAGLYSNRYALRWKMKAIRSKRLLFQLSPLGLPTAETGFGLLLTPGVVMHEESPEDYKARTIEKGYNRGNEWTSLAAQIAYMDLLPTPAVNPSSREITGGKNMSLTTGQKFGISLQQVVEQLLPTPTAGDGTKGKGGPNGKHYTAGKAIEGTNGANTGMKLQPEFVEYMMGFPEGWTDLSDSKPLETP